MKKIDYLKANIFIGLKNLNTGFDAESIYYFSESDFNIVLNRVEQLGIGILGIETWLNEEFYDVMTYEDFNTTSYDPEWYKSTFLEFKKNGRDLIYAASYEVPNKFLVSHR